MGSSGSGLCLMFGCCKCNSAVSPHDRKENRVMTSPACYWAVTLRRLDSASGHSHNRYFIKSPPHLPQDKLYIILSDPSIDVRPITADTIFNWSYPTRIAMKTVCTSCLTRFWRQIMSLTSYKWRFITSYSHSAVGRLQFVACCTRIYLEASGFFMYHRELHSEFQFPANRLGFSILYISWFNISKTKHIMLW